jgi:hypothetical protein
MIDKDHSIRCSHVARVYYVILDGHGHMNMFYRPIYLNPSNEKNKQAKLLQ